MREQKLLKASESYSELDGYFQENKIKSIFLVCDRSISFLKINKFFEELEGCQRIKVTRFSDFNPNPLYESVVQGIELFRRKQCDMIVAVGGGSAIDVAKCIKLYANMDSEQNYLEQEIVPNDIKLLVVPTTAGTGSEATRYAVIYYNGEKQSISDYSCIPQAVLMDASVLQTLPDYQKKATMLDAFCHAIESFWSVNSTEESKMYSKTAIEMILKNMERYLQNDDAASSRMLEASNMAGKAINITQTTAGHAMCYKLTSMYGIAHGHAAAVCVAKLWPYMLSNIEKCIDKRGADYLKSVFAEIADAFGCVHAQDAVDRFQEILSDLDLKTPTAVEEDFEILNKSVNPVRLKNNPVLLDSEAIDGLYRQILVFGE